MAKTNHNPPDLHSLRGLSFRPRRRVAGRYAGAHASLQRGRSVTFTDYRPYTPGDSPADIDWKVYGRSDRLVVKQHEQPCDLTVQLAIDASASMAFSGLQSTNGTAGKFAFTTRLATTIAGLITQQQDRVGLTLATPSPITLPPGTSTLHLGQLQRVLHDATPDGNATIAETLDAQAPRLPRRIMWVVISDLMEPIDPLARALSRIAARGGEAILFQTLHPDELNLPELANATLVDSETNRRLKLSPAQIKHDYQQRLRDHTDRWHRVALGLGFDHRVVNTATPVPDVLRDYLAQRTDRLRS